MEIVVVTVLIIAALAVVVYKVVKNKKNAKTPGGASGPGTIEPLPPKNSK